MPSRICTRRKFPYLKVLAETGNATIAAEAARVSRTWAYKRREVDPRFAQLFAEVAALAKARLPARVNRDRAGGWTAAKEAQFLDRLQATCSVPLAAAEVKLSTVSAYRRRQVRPGFAAAWEEAERIGWPPAELPWIESAICFFERREPPPGNPVRITSVSQVIDALEGKRFRPRRRRARRGAADGRDDPPL